MKTEPLTAREASLTACHICRNLCGTPEVPAGYEQVCPRCGAALHTRKPRSLSHTWALLLTAIILYIPANIWPVMIIEQFGRTGTQTIISGVAALYNGGMWPLALIVFTASICVPMLKVFVLLLLLTSVHLNWDWRTRHRTVMYRMITSIGRWSMVDVFVVSILVVLVRLGKFTTITAGRGAVAFAAVVVLTMLATHSFDPRILWDRADRKQARGQP
jgi:paraquat-inducible protein A